MSYIEFNHVSFGYPSKKGYEEILRDFSLKIEKGEFLVVIGQSGCGKSTLLSLLEGLILPQKGSITIDGKEVTGPDLRKSVIFQHDSLFPWMTVEKNVRFGIRQARPGISRREEKEQAYQALLRVGMEKEGSKYPGELSGGMQQRTAIARTFAMDSDIFLMDEPFGAVDPRRRTMLQELLVSLWQKRKEEGMPKTVVFVTHDIDEAVFLGDRILYLRKKGQYEEVRVPLQRPRKIGELTVSQCFCSFRKIIAELFEEEGGVTE